MALSPAEQQSRYAFDYEVVRSMLPSEILEVDGFTSREAAEKGHPATEADAKAGRVRLYLVRYTFPMLVGPGERIGGATVFLDISSKAYPFEEPSACVVTRPLPWTPHVHPKTGVICQGENFTTSRGRALLAHAIIHIAHILNLDEPDRGPGYFGYNPDATRYWRESMRCAPLNQGLPYPHPSVEVTHGVSVVPAFRILEEDIATAEGFRLFEEPLPLRLIEIP